MYMRSNDSDAIEMTQEVTQYAEAEFHKGRREGYTKGYEMGRLHYEVTDRHIKSCADHYHEGYAAGYKDAKRTANPLISISNDDLLFEFIILLSEGREMAKDSLVPTEVWLAAQGRKDAFKAEISRRMDHELCPTFRKA